MRSAFHRLLWCGLALAAALVAAPAAAQEDADVAGMVNAGVTWALDALTPDLLQDVPLPSEADWQAFWNAIGDVLNGDSLERAAAVKPYVETSIRLLSRVEGGEEYAAWLRQRLDYFEMAAAVVKEYPAAAPAPGLLPSRRPPEVPHGTVRILPSTPEPPPAPAIRVQRETAARSPLLWRRVLSHRAAPEGSIELMPRLKRAFKEEGIPPQLAWLAEVESSLNPKARNPSGAAGLFQLMPATAQRFGLRARPVDERRNPDKSAHAAARYLRFLHGQFGTWPLALAGYNAGDTRVKELLAKTGGKSFDDIAPLLPFETQMYVPKVQAVIQLREGEDVSRLPPPTASHPEP